VIEEVGEGVRNLRKGDRVVIGSTIACGNCSYCRSGYYSQCDVANPNGRQAGTAFFGGPSTSGPFDGLQAEFARVPFAQVNCVKLPDEVTDEDAIVLSDIFPTAWFGADMAGLAPGKSVVVFGCGPVGQLAIASCKLMHAGRIFAVDCIPDRLEAARAQGAEVIDFSNEDPIATLLELTGGIGADAAIDAVGIDATLPEKGSLAAKALEKGELKALKDELSEVAPKTNTDGDNWHPGNAPSIVPLWATMGLAKAGTFSIIGVYPPTARRFPLGMAMNKNLTLRMGNCPHRKYLPLLVEMVRNGTIEPSKLRTRQEPLMSAVEAYKAFDKRSPGWIKVELQPQTH
jgi:threonine dehydrogenase-like Zn-dependent dehydrogenase